MKTHLSTALALLLALLPSAARAFTATDASTNEPYASQATWNLGDNGGTGFGEWRQIGTEPNRSLDQGFAIYGNDGVGDAAIGRSFAGGTALESGTFSVSATHDSAAHFSGFALYASGDTELLRWGVTTAEADTGTYPGFWYALGAGGQTVYAPIERIHDDPYTPVAADYSISWSVFSSGMNIDLSITSDSSTITRQLSLDNSSAVTSIAALVGGSARAESLHFDNLSVTGQTVPEPSTLSLLLLGVLVLRPRRRK